MSDDRPIEEQILNPGDEQEKLLSYRQYLTRKALEEKTREEWEKHDQGS